MTANKCLASLLILFHLFMPTNALSAPRVGYEEFGLMIRAGKNDALRKALAANPLKETDTKTKQWLLTYAILHGNDHAISALIQYGASANIQLPVFELFPELLDGPAGSLRDILPIQSTESCSPLILAISTAQKPAVIEALLRGGANVSGSQADQLLPLNFALSLGHYGIADSLLEHGADPNAADKIVGMTPLMELALARTTDKQAAINRLIVRLVAAGAKINASNHRGVTALMFAVVAKNPASVSMLLQQGANPNLLDDKGESALTKAQKGGQGAIQKLLSERAAKEGL